MVDLTNPLEFGFNIVGNPTKQPEVKQAVVVGNGLSGGSDMLRTGDKLPTGVTYTGPPSNISPYGEYIPTTSGNGVSNGLPDFFSGWFGSGTPSGGLLSGGIGLNLPTLALAYGLYSMFIRKRRGLLPMAALGFGVYGTGILQSLFPNESGTSVALKTVAAGIMPAGLGMAALVGLGPALIYTIGKGLFSRRSRKRTRPRVIYYNRSRRYRRRY